MHSLTCRRLCSSFRALHPHSISGKPPVLFSSLCRPLKLIPAWTSNGANPYSLKAATAWGHGAQRFLSTKLVLCSHQVTGLSMGDFPSDGGLWVAAVLRLGHPIAAVLNDCSFFGPLVTCCCGDCFHSNVCCPSRQLMKWLLKLWGPC